VSRDAKDSAIEHAGYLVTRASACLAAINAYLWMLQEKEEGEIEPTQAEEDAKAEELDEAMSGVREAIYEFEKRRARANEATHSQGREPT
jgi:hypothetical protein